MNNPIPWQAATLVVNTRSRRGARLFREASDRLRAEGIDLVHAIAEAHPARMRGQVERAVEAGADLIIVGGGDGSISGTIGALLGSDCTFAPLPLGTANSFARTLGIGTDLQDAVAAITGGQTRKVDLGEIDGRMFANSASIGLSPIIGETIPSRLKRYLGRLGYLLWGIGTMLRFRPFRVTIDCDGQVRTCWATEVRMLNGCFAGGIQLTDDASLGNGRIVVQIVTGKSKLRLAADWYLRIVGLADAAEGVEELEGRQIQIRTSPPQMVSLDGEVQARTPVQLKVHHAAVKVVIPAGQDSADLSLPPRKRAAPVTGP